MGFASSLSDDAIRDILTSRHIGHSAMGRRYGRSHQSIAQIRLGQSCAARVPEVPRWTGDRSCEQCRHWAGRCDLGFPDPLEESVRFANDCAVFTEVTP